ncbi:helix-turn-helix domain-containing protein [Wohlfahrtiimonas chitiniclastica]|uniref:helix-turn-helix domain-containing protein n=2 Tax=Gammaproteobacteria TaxID=1236 RepID=UPI002157D634|nr:helix-turn-helix domain-containing protein [Wohlfahrtiimonas chitiniclastica]MDC7253100.1 replication protein [Wohlfahrtiimonas chitiniclastica]
MAAVEQLSLFDRAEEARAYHDPARAGFFSILVDVNGDKRQSSHRLIEMPTVLELIDKSRDTWLTQAEFIRPNRRVVNLARLGLLFADLDTYRTPWAKGRTPEQLAASVLYHCAQEGIPTPSMLIFSGRGIQAKWLLDGTIPRQALPRWNACQKYLIDRLRPVGADVAAKDASRVLRLVETVNSKSGEICRVVHVENGPDGQPVRYSFEYLAEMLLPVARWTIEQQRQERAERRQLKLLSGAKTDNLRGFSGRQLAWHRLEDLRKLATLRGGVSEGERMQHLFWRLNFLLLSGATHSSQMYYEAKALAGELAPTWAYRDKELMTLYSKAKAYEKGEKISFAGREFAPLYTPKNDTLINLFQITDDEQRELKTIISKGMAAERHKDREADRRRAAGAVDRETYLEAAKTKQAQAQELREQGMTQKQIAEKMGVGLRSVKRYLAEGAKSVRITNGEAHARAVGPAFE